MSSLKSHLLFVTLQSVYDSYEQTGTLITQDIRIYMLRIAGWTGTFCIYLFSKTRHSYIHVVYSRLDRYILYLSI